MEPFRLSHGLPGLVGELAVGLAGMPDILTLPDGRLALVSLNRFYGGDLKGYVEHHRADDGTPVFGPAVPVHGPVAPTRTLDLDGDGGVETVALEKGGLALYRPGFGLQDDGSLAVGRREALRDQRGRPLKLAGGLVRVEVLVEEGTFHLVVGTNDWSQYWPLGENPWRGWECEVGLGKGYTADGRWLGGPLIGKLLFLRNRGTAARPRFAPPAVVAAGGREVVVYGNASPTALPGAHGLDLVVGDFMDQLTYLRRLPGEGLRLAAPRPVRTPGGKPVVFQQNIMHPQAVDWRGKGAADIVAGAEDGRFWLARRAETKGGAPRFQPPTAVAQVGPELSAGVLAVPTVCDWFGRGLPDLLVGNAAGFIEVYRNVGSTGKPRYELPRHLTAGGRVIRIQAGYAGSIQGPSEAKWGYTCPCVCDWDGDGRLDVLMGDITGYQTLYRNIGTRRQPRLAPGVRLTLEGRPFQTVWRVRPQALDWDGDGRAELLALDQEGLLTLYRQHPGDPTRLLEPRHLHDCDGAPIHLDGPAGHEGRAKLAVCDWDGDGDWDLFVGLHRDEPLARGAAGATVVYLENVGTNARPYFAPPRQVHHGGRPLSFGCHCCSPEPTALFGEPQPSLLIGVEDGGLYYYPREILSW